MIAVAVSWRLLLGRYGLDRHMRTLVLLLLSSCVVPVMPAAIGGWRTSTRAGPPLYPTECMRGHE
jgi:hypothetical protein